MKLSRTNCTVRSKLHIAQPLLSIASDIHPVCSFHFLTPFQDFFVLFGVYLFSLLSATLLHFFPAIFLHFITAPDIEKSIYSQPGTSEHDQEVYRLTSKGRDFCRRELSICRQYSAQNPAHDLALADRYFSLSETERETWRTESQSRDAVKEYIQQLREQGEEERSRELWERLEDGRLSMPDAVYTRSDGVSVAFEVVTNNYGREELEAKEQASETLGAQIEFYKV